MVLNLIRIIVLINIIVLMIMLIIVIALTILITRYSGSRSECVSDWECPSGRCLLIKKQFCNAQGFTTINYLAKQSGGRRYVRREKTQSNYAKIAQCE